MPSPYSPPAFASPHQNGMSLRDWFAGQALAGICSANDTWPRLEDGDYISKLVYALADSMLAAREVASDDA